MARPGVRWLRSGLRGLSAFPLLSATTCRACPIVDVCGGGLLAHRFSVDGDFTMPSVYCADLYRLVSHVRARVELSLRDRLALSRSGAR